MFAEPITSPRTMDFRDSAHTEKTVQPEEPPVADDFESGADTISPLKRGKHPIAVPP